VYVLPAGFVVFCYSLLVCIEHDGDESPRDVLIKSADPVCIQMATVFGMPLRYKEEKLEDGERKRERDKEGEKCLIQ
jgi:hypothetical protein